MVDKQLSTSELVNAKFAESRGYANTAFKEASNLLDSLVAAVPQLTFPNVNTSIPVDTYNPSLVPFSYIAPTIDWPSRGSVQRPVIKDIPESTVVVPSLITPKITGSITEPAEVTLDPIPSVVVPALPIFKGNVIFPDFDISDIVSQVRNILNNLSLNIATVGGVILNFITNPQQAIGNDMVDAMTTSMLQKVDDDFQVKYNEVSAYFSSRGWNTPQGVLVGRMTELDRAHFVQRSAIQRDVLIKNFELSQQNFLAALQMYIQYIHENNILAVSALNVLFDAIKYSHEIVIAELNAFLSLYQADVTVFKTSLDAQVQIAGMTIEKNKALISQYLAQVQAFSTKITAISSYNQDLVKKMEAEITAYSANIQGLSASNSDVIKAYTADIQKYTTDVQESVSKADVAIKLSGNELAAFDTNAKFELTKAQITASNSGLLLEAKKAEIQLTLGESESNIKNMLAISNLTVEIAKSAATIAAQLAASSMSAVSAGASLGYHESANYDMTKDTVETQIKLSGSV